MKYYLPEIDLQSLGHFDYQNFVCRAFGLTRDLVSRVPVRDYAGLVDELLGNTVHYPLQEHERFVLQCMFRGLTPHTISELIKRTRERVRQIEAKALRKVRHPSRGRQVRELLDALGAFDEYMATTYREDQERQLREFAESLRIARRQRRTR